MATQMQANVRRMIVRTRSKLSRDGRVIEAEGLRRRAAEENSNISAYYQWMVPKKCSLPGTGAARNNLPDPLKFLGTAIWAIELGDEPNRGSANMSSPGGATTVLRFGPNALGHLTN